MPFGNLLKMGAPMALFDRLTAVDTMLGKVMRKLLRSDVDRHRLLNADGFPSRLQLLWRFRRMLPGIWRPLFSVVAPERARREHVRD
jgi:hypothetical protein